LHLKGERKRETGRKRGCAVRERERTRFGSRREGKKEFTARAIDQAVAGKWELKREGWPLPIWGSGGQSEGGEKEASTKRAGS